MSYQGEATGTVPSGISREDTTAKQGQPAGSPAARSSSTSKRAPTLSDIASKYNIAQTNADPADKSAGDGEAAGALSPSQGGTGLRGRLGLAGRLIPGETAPALDAATGSTKVGDEAPSSPKKAEGSTPFPSLDGIRERLSRKGLTHSKSKSQMDAPGAKTATTEPKENDSAAAENSAANSDGANTPAASRTPEAGEPKATSSTPAAENTALAASASVPVLAPAKPPGPPPVKPNVSSGSTPSLSSRTPVIGPDGKTVHPLQHKWTLYFDSKSWNPSNAASTSQQSTPANTPQLGGSSPSANLPYPTNLAASSPAAGASQHVPPSPISPTTPAPGAQAPSTWEAALRMLGAYNDVESFFATFSTLRRPSQLEKSSNYHLFKDGIKPMWEDRRNAKGGKWTLTLKATNNPALLDRSWMWLVLALIGEELDPHDMITGAVVSVRAKGDRLSIWTRSKDDVNKLNDLARRFVSILDLEKEPGVGLEFSYNTGQSLPQPNGFWTFYNLPTQHPHSYQGQPGHTAGPYPGTPSGRQHALGGFGPGSPAQQPRGSNAGVFSPPSGPGAPGRSVFGAGTPMGGAGSGALSGQGTSMLRRAGSDNPFARNPKIVAPSDGGDGAHSGPGAAMMGTSPSKSGTGGAMGRSGTQSGLAPPGADAGPRPVLGSASPIKRGGALP
ncbi:translation initiation factor eIF4e [Tilletiaria anomala UBC 951]|uniref:Translation initiation factor eIF4e n=1 Tax=Tilletiaria anomala (strain ATCC 24038 / CBS 436.72 / UBC 951) TaxID=1037660 RepID=A0A066VP30_TILAU|nr:translation initiation factor eIF4e [Tilletiaria anomala UBC 951]KDN43221.1 translation initiation factor eIF4e [Tilletiaria anomala UBC 951]